MADRPAPSPTAMLIGTAIISLLTGYMLGMASNLGLIPNPLSALTSINPRPTSRRPAFDNSEESSASEVDEDASLLDHAPNWANGVEADKRQGLKMVDAEEEPTKPKKSKTEKKGKKETGNEKPTAPAPASVPQLGSPNEECKLVLVVRTDLGMTKGKIAAQCGHATLACYKNISSTESSSQADILRRWERQGQAKVALQVKNEDEMQELQAKALSLGLVAEVIADAGRTQIASGSHTVLGIGPAPKSVVDSVTGHLKLL